MKYPKVYHQMQAMLDYCRANREKCQDPAYVDTLITELETRCELIELEHQDDDFTGELDDYFFESDDLTDESEDFEEAA